MAAQPLHLGPIEPPALPGARHTHRRVEIPVLQQPSYSSQCPCAQGGYRSILRAFLDDAVLTACHPKSCLGGIVFVKKVVAGLVLLEAWRQFPHQRIQIDGVEFSEELCLT